MPEGRSRRDVVRGEWRADPARFWIQAAETIDWIRSPTQAFGDSGDSPWFAGATLNTCFNAVDRHVQAGRGAQSALIYDSPVTGSTTHYTYDELLEEVSRLAGLLHSCGVRKGDRVIIYMPMIPQAVFGMLACARIGAIHSVVFGGFAAPELAKRIEDAKPTLILSASCGIEPGRLVLYKPLLDEALRLSSHHVPRVLVWQRDEARADMDPSRDLDWQEGLVGTAPVECIEVKAEDPLYILYTSGTTGVPKGVVRDNGGHAVALAWSLTNIFGVAPGEVFWAASDIGWVVGHSFIVYGPLIQGCTTVLFEGKPVGTPDPGTFWRIVRDHEVDVFFTAPTAIRAIKREDPEGHYIAPGVGKLRALFLAGERADPDTLQWAEDRLNIPIVDHWWQTELGWPALAACVGLGDTTTKHGSAGRPVPGFDFEVIDEEHQAVANGVVGEIVIRLPLPPGCLSGLWNNREGFHSSYLEPHPGFYVTGDAGFIDDEGFVHVMSRIDDIINVAGHRLSTGGIEQVVAAHPDVAECAVVGFPDALKGQVPLGLVVLKSTVTRDHSSVLKEIIASVRREVGPVASFKLATVVRQLPKTRSGKVLRSTIRKIASDDVFVIPATIEDPSVLAEIRISIAEIISK